MGKLFGTDGIRGVANTYPLDVETATAVGRAIATYFATKRSDNGFIVIGQDTRLSGDMIAQAVSAGICSAGTNVAAVGVMPTPAVAFLARHSGAAAGVVISASHNPFEDNGIKLFDGTGHKINDRQEETIEGLIEKVPEKITAHQLGRRIPMDDAQDLYLGFLKGALTNPSLNGVTLVLDCSNGATYRVAPQLFESMGAEVVSLFCEPDGININSQCGSQHPEALAGEVVARGADLGLAFDGDGDRLIAVDEKGTILTGDQIIAICAKDLLDKGALSGNKVVTTVMSNMGFRIAMKDLGIELHTTQVGDRYVMQEMIAQGAVLGGEDSGHMIFRDHHTTGDGIMAALRLLEALQAAEAPLSELSQMMTVFPQVLINVDVKAKPELGTIPEIGESIKAAEAQLEDKGRVLVRYSGTQPQCRVMVEGPTEAITRQLCGQIADVVRLQLG
jgi:phosphoglucosamine mutase